MAIGFIINFEKKGGCLIGDGNATKAPSISSKAHWSSVVVGFNVNHYQDSKEREPSDGFVTVQALDGDNSRKIPNNGMPLSKQLRTVHRQFTDDLPAAGIDIGPSAGCCQEPGCILDSSIHSWSRGKL